jgi:hypothetical protein
MPYILKPNLLNISGIIVVIIILLIFLMGIGETLSKVDKFFIIGRICNYQGEIKNAT